MHLVSFQADGEFSESLFSYSLSGQHPSPWQQLRSTTGSDLKQRLVRFSIHRISQKIMDVKLGTTHGSIWKILVTTMPPKKLRKSERNSQSTS